MSAAQARVAATLNGMVPALVELPYGVDVT
jgi:hypothetical protein